MKQMFLYIVFAMMASVVVAQKSEQMKWLARTWKINAGGNVIIEQWKIANDSTLVGKSYFIKDGTDTIPQETVELVYRKDSWYYISTVKDQNDSKPVQFKIIFLNGTEFISENPAHDFPQRIAYRRIKNQLFASIEGNNKGRYSKENFDFSTD